MVTPHGGKVKKMADILGPGFLDTTMKEIKTKLLTMEGDIHLGTHFLKWTDILLKRSSNQFLAIRNAEDTANRGLDSPDLGYPRFMYQVNVNAARMKFYKTFTSSPALADMYDREIALGNGTGGGGEDEIFFKPDADKIIAIAVTGTTITARSIMS